MLYLNEQSYSYFISFVFFSNLYLCLHDLFWINQQTYQFLFAFGRGCEASVSPSPHLESDIASVGHTGFIPLVHCWGHQLWQCSCGDWNKASLWHHIVSTTQDVDVSLFLLNNSVVLNPCWKPYDCESIPARVPDVHLPLFWMANIDPQPYSRYIGGHGVWSDPKSHLGTQSWAVTLLAFPHWSLARKTCLGIEMAEVGIWGGAFDRPWIRFV